MRLWTRCYKRYLTPSQDKDAFPARQLFVLGTSSSSSSVHVRGSGRDTRHQPVLHVTLPPMHLTELYANTPVQHYAESASQLLS